MRRTQPTSGKRGWGALACGVIILAGFAAYTQDVVQDVSNEREAVTRRVSVLIALQRVQSAFDGLREGSAEPAALVEARVAVERGAVSLAELDALEGAIDMSLREVTALADSRLAGEAEEDAAATEHLAVSRAIGVVRAANSAGSERLGVSWHRLERLAWLSILFAALILGLLMRLHRIARRLALARETTRAQLLQSERGFQRVIEASPYGIVLLKDGTVAYANSVVGRTLARPGDALLGRRLTEFVIDAEVVQSGVLEDGEHRFHAGSGHAHVEVVQGPEVLFEGESHRLCVLRDISEKRAMESQLRLTDRLSALGSVAAGIAHEINNPLAYVLANANVLRSQIDDLELGPVARETLTELTDDVREGASRVRDVVRGLRTLSHPSDEELGPVDLGPVVASAYAIVHSDLSHRAEVSVDIPASTPTVRGNEARLGQVVLNLLVNAAQAFSDDRGSPGCVEVRATHDDSRVRLVISDDGPGMSEEVLARVFEPFFTTKPIGEGTGLGLTICRRIIQNLGGELEVSSTLGEGTVVTISLQMDLASKPSERVRKRALTPDHSAKVLIIDDEPRVGASLARLLRGHRCTVVTSGAEGLELMATESFDLVFCDLMMPEMTGMDVHAALREQGEQQERSLVFVTGGAFTARARAFVSSCSNTVVEKPFDSALVRDIVRDHIKVPEPLAAAELDPRP
ncbi:MAG: ATP-binding protein [Polyangiales bacterium]